MEVINPVPNPGEIQDNTAYQSTPVYQAPPVPQAPVISLGDWFVTVLLISIPVVNIIVLLIWAFGSGTNPNKANFAKANLIWVAVGLVLFIFFFSSIMALFMALR